MSRFGVKEEKSLNDLLSRLQKDFPESSSIEERLEFKSEKLSEIFLHAEVPPWLKDWVREFQNEIKRLLDHRIKAEKNEDILLEKLKELEQKINRMYSHNKRLKEKNVMASIEIRDLSENNEKLQSTAKEIKNQIQKLREEVNKLKAPPLVHGVFIKLREDEATATVNVDGKYYDVMLANQEIKPQDIESGHRVLLNGAFNIVGLENDFTVGEVAKVIDILEDDRIILKASESEEHVARKNGRLREEQLRIGDNVRYDPYTQLVYEILPKREMEEVVLEEIPDVRYEDIGGLDHQLEQIKDSIELPYIYAHLYHQFNLKPPKGILLYGPPGCGKTLVAKAVAHNLSLRIKNHLEKNREAILLYKDLISGEEDSAALLSRFDHLKKFIYREQALYIPSDIDQENQDKLFTKLNKSGIVGDFIRRNEGVYYNEPKPVGNIKDWYDFLIELKLQGYGALLSDQGGIARMVEEKRKNYFLRRKKVSDLEYATRWVREFLVNNSIDMNDVDTSLEETNRKLGSGLESYFLNIKGPELLNKYVGETEYRIREVFQKAKEKASYGLPVIVFFDEMESMFRVRGSGRSSDVETTIVPQFLAEIDGVERLNNVIVIGASNRQDLIDPAVLRAGRLDVKIKIDRPSKEAAKDIFSKYLRPDIPLADDELKSNSGDLNKTVERMIEKAVHKMYKKCKENQFLRVTYQNREQEVLYFKDFASGAMIEGIVARAKTRALKRMIITGEKGLRTEDILRAITGEYKENEDLPNTTNPDDWAKIAGRKGEKIVSIETLLPSPSQDAVRESEEIAVSSRYL